MVQRTQPCTAEVNVFVNEQGIRYYNNVVACERSSWKQYIVVHLNFDKQRLAWRIYLE